MRTERNIIIINNIIQGKGFLNPFLSKLKSWFPPSIIIKLINSFNLILISLTYLRGLEVAELKEEDMPMVYK